ncbi:PTHR1 [Acanthosepion pharaonis]|uniref:PTHR1 n=1 Tax=Acanthosepion pharaonis TaxID=158019 RepID=A0A812B1E7_ACAPH|nr:PTHR1 [Sepia pharaonis]
MNLLQVDSDNHITAIGIHANGPEGKQIHFTFAFFFLLSQLNSSSHSFYMSNPLSFPILSFTILSFLYLFLFSLFVSLSFILFSPTFFLYLSFAIFSFSILSFSNLSFSNLSFSNLSFAILAFPILYFHVPSFSITIFPFTLFLSLFSHSLSPPLFLPSRFPHSLFLSLFPLFLSSSSLSLSLLKLRCRRNTIHVNLFLSFIFRAVLALTKDNILVDGLGFSDDLQHSSDGTRNFIPNVTRWGCKLFFTTINYTIGANYMWVFIEGLYLHTLIYVSVFADNPRTKWYIISGWALPLLFVIPWAIGRSLLSDEHCWNTHENRKLFWIIRGPCVGSVLVKYFTLIKNLSLSLSPFLSLPLSISLLFSFSLLSPSLCRSLSTYFMYLSLFHSLSLPFSLSCSLSLFSLPLSVVLSLLISCIFLFFTLSLSFSLFLSRSRYLLAYLPFVSFCITIYLNI